MEKGKNKEKFIEIHSVGHTHIYAHTQTHIYTQTYTYTHTHTHYTNMQIYTDIHVYTHRETHRVCAQSLSRARLCSPMDHSPPGSSVHGILQARILEWVAISSSRGSSGPRDQTPVSCIAGRFFISLPPEIFFTA